MIRLRLSHLGTPGKARASLIIPEPERPRRRHHDCDRWVAVATMSMLAK